MFPPDFFAPTYFASSYFAPGVAALPPSGGGGGGYFAPSYFAPSYFAPTYFPSAAQPVPPSVPGVLAEAVRTRVTDGVSTLTDFYNRETPGKTAAGTPPVYPYCIYNVLGESPEWVTGSNLYPGWLDVQMTFVSDDHSEAEAARDAAYRLFTPRRNPDGSAANEPLATNDGTVPAFGCLPGRKTEYKNPGKGAGGKPIWLFSFAMRCYVTREM